MHIAKKLVWVGLGLIALFLAVIAYIVPLIPTTPFILVAAWCFTKGSQRMHNWLMYRTFLGKLLRNYNDNKGIPLWVKVVAVTCMWGSTLFTSIVLPMGYFTQISPRYYLIFWIVMPLASGIGSYFVLRVPTTKNNDDN